MSALLNAMEATWPAAEVRDLGPFRLRRGLGGGQRVSAATALSGDWRDDDIARAEAEMRTMNQRPLFMLREGEDRLDAALAARGYDVKDPVSVYAGSAAAVAGEGPGWLSTFPHWPPLAAACDLWSEASVGLGRLAVMDRVAGAKAAILGRAGDRAAGVVFVAVAEGIGFLHSLHVTPALRRQGMARNLLRASAGWVVAEGGKTLALAVTTANEAARELYASAGMDVVAGYHYRRAGLVAG